MLGRRLGKAETAALLLLVLLFFNCPGRECTVRRLLVLLFFNGRSMSQSESSYTRGERMFLLVLLFFNVVPRRSSPTGGRLLVLLFFNLSLPSQRGR